MPNKLDITTERMLALMAWALAKELAPTETAYLVGIGFTPSNINNIRRGVQNFTIKHITNACRLTGANANWILGLEGNMLRKPGKTAMEQLQEAVVAVDQELKARNKTRNNPAFRSNKT